MTKSSSARASRRKDKRTRARRLQQRGKSKPGLIKPVAVQRDASPEERRKAFGRDLFAEILGTVGDVSERHYATGEKADTETIVQALLLLGCNAAIQHGVDQERVLSMVTEYLSQVSGVIQRELDLRRGKVTDGGLVLPD